MSGLKKNNSEGLITFPDGGSIGPVPWFDRINKNHLQDNLLWPIYRMKLMSLDLHYPCKVLECFYLGEFVFFNIIPSADFFVSYSTHINMNTMFINSLDPISAICCMFFIKKGPKLLSPDMYTRKVYAFFWFFYYLFF